MENKIPSIYPMKLPKKYAYENKRNKIALKKETKFNTDYFKEPIFFNKSNIDFQLNTLNIMFRPKDKSQTIQSENNSRHYINNNITNLDTETTNTETLPKLTKSEIIEKQKKKRRRISLL